MSSRDPQYQLKQPPSDGITRVRFANSSNRLAVSSWDKGVRVYNASDNRLLAAFEQKAAVLDCCWSADDIKIFSGGIDRDLIIFDPATKHEMKVGSHSDAIRCVENVRQTNHVATGSWDHTVCLWDPRSQQPLVGKYDQPGKVYAMCSSGHKLVVGTGGRHVNIYDVRNMSQVEQRRESSLKHQTRDISAMIDGRGYVLSSIEGRVAVEFFDTAPEVQKKKYAFKCHRQAIEGVQTVYPVNAIAFHPKHGTFLSGGCDGIVNIWDGVNKKRICQLPAFPTSVASADFNHDGSLLAVASSYTFEQGQKTSIADQVYIRQVREFEVQPKAKKRPRE